MLSLFQFHFGPIIRLKLMTIGLPFISVSIPLWSDYKQRRTPAGHVVQCVSIPLWSDYKAKWLLENVENILVSIPLWSDYKSVSG